MVNLILKYIKQPLTAYLPFVTRVDSPVYRISSGEVFSGVGSEKENVSISDNIGKGLYIRQIQQEQVKEKKKFTSCDTEYEITARCKAVFYSFSQDEFVVNPDKVSARIIGALKKVNFNQYAGSAKEITIDILSSSTDFEKIFTEETNKRFEGDNWPVIVSVEFNLNYEDINCVPCDIDDNDNPITWEPDLTPENCETKAICEVIEKCEVIDEIKDKLVDLQNQIDNIPGGGGVDCDTVAQCQVIIDINQQLNDIINSLPDSYFSCEDLETCEVIENINQIYNDLETTIATILGRLDNAEQDISNLQNLTASDLDALQRDGSNANSDIDINGYSLNAKSFHVKGTGGNGHLGLKHQNANITASTSESSLGANSTGKPVWKNDGNPIEELAYKSYVDSEINSAVAGLLDDRGNYDASSNLYPSSGGSGTSGAILKGDLWTISVSGILGGVAVTVGDVVRALVDSPSQTSSNWVVTENNIGYVPENSTNKSTSIITDAGSNTKFPSVKSVYDWAVSTFKANFTENTAFNKNFGTTAGTVLEGNRITQTITNGVTDKAPSEDAVFDALEKGTKTIYIDLTTTSLTPGSTAITLLKSALIAGNTFIVNDTISIKALAHRGLTSLTGTQYLYINTTNSLSGATLIGTYGVAGFRASIMFRDLFLLSQNQSRGVVGSVNNPSTYAGGAAIVAVFTTFDFANDLYVIQAYALADAGDTSTSSGLIITRTR